MSLLSYPTPVKSTLACLTKSMSENIMGIVGTMTLSNTPTGDRVLRRIINVPVCVLARSC